MRALALFGLLLLGWLTAGAAHAAPININTADEAALDGLPGIGSTKAQAIIAHREANGPFASLDDLDAVKGIGPSTLANLQSLITFTDGGAPAADAPASPASGGPKVNINTATADALDNLPGIGPSKAQAIVEHREAHGPFPSCADLSAVTGIGDATVANIADVCTTD